MGDWFSPWSSWKMEKIGFYYNLNVAFGGPVMLYRIIISYTPYIHLYVVCVVPESVKKLSSDSISRWQKIMSLM
jgi:hypothetical protein